MSSVFMKNFVTKKNISLAALALLGVFFVITNPIMFGLCQSISTYDTGTKYCNYSVVDIVPEGISLLIFFLSSSFFILTLITYKMREEVFHAWWSFARWFAPVIIIVTVLQSMQGGGGGLGIGGAISGGFDRLVLGPFFTIFVVTSLSK